MNAYLATRPLQDKRLGISASFSAKAIRGAASLPVNIAKVTVKPVASANLPPKLKKASSDSQNTGKANAA
ncbi:hypothetical protein [Erythrobacter sp.]|uniref:hypothetical protein n=1 Tax=Erythrobacter sp. TaxID=1042 RepID=UPI002EA73F45|nr:hypothetical protein [Erythrobacter sp.]